MILKCSSIGNVRRYDFGIIKGSSSWGHIWNTVSSSNQLVLIKVLREWGSKGKGRKGHSELRLNDLSYSEGSKSRFKFFRKGRLGSDLNQLCCAETGKDNWYKIIQAGVKMKTKGQKLKSRSANSLKNLRWAIF